MCKEKNSCLKNLLQGVDIPQILFLGMFITLLIITCFLVVRPFIPGFAWASMVVITTWPLLIKLQKLLWGRRTLAIIVMILILVLLFIIPITLLINSLIDNIIPIIQNLTSGKIQPPNLDWLIKIPIIGAKLYSSWHSLLAGESNSIIAYLKPYMGRTTSFVFSQGRLMLHLGARLMLHLSLMLLFSILLYWRGEQIAQGVRHFARRIATHRGDAAVLLASQAIRAVALGVTVTALVQGILGGIGLAISGIPYATLLTVLLICFCLMQLGTLPVLIPAIIWLYWRGDTTYGTLLIIWSCIVVTLDNILRPFLIRMGADLPIILILCGVIGGMFTFGMIGLFIGPVVLAISYRLLTAWMNESPTAAEDDKLNELGGK
ncbi:MAG: AI-2E family transporter YdiK [Candidatus Dasytiphilus stammeri]